MFLKIIRRRFCSGTPFHHDYIPMPPKEDTLLITALEAFDFARIVLYIYVGFRVMLSVPYFLTFRKRKFLNNPDYNLCDKETYLKIQAKKL